MKFVSRPILWMKRQQPYFFFAKQGPWNCVLSNTFHFRLFDSFSCPRKSAPTLPTFTYVSVCTVTRVSTIVEILKIWSSIFSNKNPVNSALLLKFSLFLHNFGLFHIFFHIFTEKFKLSKNDLVILSVCMPAVNCSFQNRQRKKKNVRTLNQS